MSTASRLTSSDTQHAQGLLGAYQALSPLQQEAIRRAAYQQARHLRQEALDDFWQDSQRWMHDAAHEAQRLAERSAHRLWSAIQRRRGALQVME